MEARQRDNFVLRGGFQGFRKTFPSYLQLGALHDDFLHEKTVSFGVNSSDTVHSGEAYARSVVPRGIGI